ncbi:cullin-3 [Coemansia reversa NRRL 1564]|uniref:Cullin-3 n=1 Tax=Coemansia reversa (strain ATCC 12441 / NRRL 1564) TaxID=763665 RepID=A0A2G5B635_COERN|nr:cullin-3 [Coemansia reversa NRRL 1564]|eukprot:PIA14461.1 cullin-3 [Coemansia reversa NRRL 1564]
MSSNKRPGGRILPVRRLTPQVDPQQQFEKLATAIGEIYKHNASQLSFEELYRIGYGLVLSKNGALAYDGVRGVLETHLGELVHSSIIGHAEAARAGPSPTNNEALLSSVRMLWSEHVTAMLIIKDVLMYVDRVYVKNAHLPSVYEMGMSAFRDQVLLVADRRLITGVVKAVLGQISNERRGIEINRSVLRGVVDMLIELQDTEQLRPLYETMFEPQMLLETRAYYHEMASARLNDHGAAAYTRAAQDDIDAEMGRVRAFLAPSTGTALRNVLLDELIAKHASQVLSIPGAGLQQLLDQRSGDALGVLFGLYAPLPAALEILQSSVFGHIQEQGEKFAAALAPISPESPQTLGAAAKTAMALRWVQEVLGLYDVYDEFLHKSFGGSHDMRKVVNDAFIQLINANNRAAELLSLFIDDNLKNGLKRKSEQEIDHLLERSVLMFRFLQNKDAFEHYYKVHLAKRLLHGRSLSDDAEQSMVSKLKLECGSQFTLKLEGMFKDMQVSADLARGFKDMGALDELGFDMNVSVLTPTFWPALALPTTEDAKKCADSIRLPSLQLRNAVDEFNKYYLTHHSARRLSWQHSMGNADIKIQFGTRTHELNVSTYQMLILMLFADGEDDASLTTSEIQQRTCIPEAMLMRQLQSLACAKYKILTKTPMSRDVGLNDRFSFNDSFRSPQYRIRIPVVAAKNVVESEKEKAESMASIGRERQYLVEAAVVRIMKTRKQMVHEQLVNEVIHQLSAQFLPTSTMIKDVIGRLIDREYLQRSPDDPRLYNYLA